MKKRIKLFIVAGLFLVTALEARTSLGNGFWLEDNNVTITCKDAQVGDTVVHNTETYTKRNYDPDIPASHQITVDNAATACTSGITDMSKLFNEKGTFNENISHWDTSSVTNMESLFSQAFAFNIMA